MEIRSLLPSPFVFLRHFYNLFSNWNIMVIQLKHLSQRNVFIIIYPTQYIRLKARFRLNYNFFSFIVQQNNWATIIYLRWLTNMSFNISDELSSVSFLSILNKKAYFVQVGYDELDFVSDDATGRIQIIA